MLTAEELLAGSGLTFDVEIPPHILNPDNSSQAPGGEGARTVKLKPLTVKDLQLVSRAAKDNEKVTAALMVQCSLVEPKLSVPEVMGLHVGLLQFLLGQVNRISGIEMASPDLREAVESPLVKAAFILSKQFGWTPGEFNDLTLGQVLLHLQKLKSEHHP